MKQPPPSSSRGFIPTLHYRKKRYPVLSLRPRLLVSVRNAAESQIAMQGGADIIDVKEPLNGSLGRASVEVLDSIGGALEISPRTMPREFPDSLHENEFPQLSLALGEVIEWDALGSDLVDDYRAVIQKIRPAFLKLGLANTMASSYGIEHWKQAWQRVRHAFPGNHDWVAVAYADHERANSPAVEAVLLEAFASGCKVMLIDTHVKDGSTLLDWLSGPQLQQLRHATRAGGIQLALAGRVTEEILPTLLALHADIIGVRGAVCDNGQRTAPVCSERVQAFRAAMQSK